jgi:hypothetical protein
MSNSTPKPSTAMVPSRTQMPTRPNPVQLLFHVGKTSRLAGSILADPRVTIFRKILFIGSILLLLLALLAPETLGDVFSTTLFPILGIELPSEAALDWIAVVIAAFNMLKVFPEEVVADHYRRLFVKAPKP